MPVYNTVGRYLKGIPTVATGLIVKGLARPELKVELDIEAVLPRMITQRNTPARHPRLVQPAD